MKILKCEVRPLSVSVGVHLMFYDHTTNSVLHFVTFFPDKGPYLGVVYLFTVDLFLIIFFYYMCEVCEK